MDDVVLTRARCALLNLSLVTQLLQDAHNDTVNVSAADLAVFLSAQIDALTTIIDYINSA